MRNHGFEIEERHIAFLKMIENGAYGSEIPDDEETCEILSDLEKMGLISWDAARMDDFYYPTKQGLAALAASPVQG